jgi:allantoin racemase
MTNAAVARSSPMLIWHQSMATLSEFGPYGELLEKHLQSILPADVVVHVHGASAKSYAGRSPAEVLKFPYLKHLVQSQALAACRRAEDSGYDAVALATFGDPFLRECRSLVDIPVASMPESCMLVASSLASRAALISLAPASVHRVRDLIVAHGMQSRVSGVYSLAPAMSEHGLVELMSGSDLGDLTTNLERVAARAASDGAEMLILAEGALNELLWSQGIRSLGGVPVLDALGVTMSYTRLMVDLKRRNGIDVSRVSTYARPPADLRAGVEAAFENG